MGEQPARFWRQLSAQWCELVQNGCDPVLLRRQALVTPVCGLALPVSSKPEVKVVLWIPAAMAALQLAGVIFAFSVK